MSTTTRRQQLDSNLLNLGSSLPLAPKSGWTAEIRKALLITTTQLARRLGLNQSTVSRLERSEAEQTITLSSLMKMADALGCDLRYVLIPRKSLQETVFQQANKKLKLEDRRIEHSMVLEAQATYGKHELNEAIRTAFFLDQMGSKIWDEDVS